MDEQKKRIYDLEILSGSSHFDECNECKKRILIPWKIKLTWIADFSKYLQLLKYWQKCWQLICATAQIVIFFYK